MLAKCTHSEQSRSSFEGAETHHLALDLLICIFFLSLAVFIHSDVEGVIIVVFQVSNSGLGSSTTLTLAHWNDLTNEQREKVKPLVISSSSIDMPLD